MIFTADKPPQRPTELFDFDPVANTIEPHHRPSHAIAPPN
jgi:hypothetical protein